MILLFYFLCAIAGFSAIAAFAIYSYLLRERELAAYAALIASLTVLTAADALFHFSRSLFGGLSGTLFIARIVLVVSAQILFAVLLPHLIAVLIRKRITAAERGIVVLFAAVLSTVAVYEALYRPGHTEASVSLLLVLILYGITRTALSFASIADTLKPFIRAALVLNAVMIIGNIVYSAVTLRSVAPMYPLGMAFYFLAWNVYNIAALFMILARIHAGPKDVSLDALSGRERQIAEFALEGRTNKEIADLFSISVFTVKSHIKSIHRKTGIRMRSRFRTRLPKR